LGPPRPLRRTWVFVWKKILARAYDAVLPANAALQLWADNGGVASNFLKFIGPVHTPQAPGVTRNNKIGAAMKRFGDCEQQVFFSHGAGEGRVTRKHGGSYGRGKCWGKKHHVYIFSEW